MVVNRFPRKATVDQSDAATMNPDHLHRTTWLGRSFTIGWAIIAFSAMTGCSNEQNTFPPKTGVTSPPKTTVASPAQHAPISALPDFVEIVKREGPAVVNISTTRAPREAAPWPGFPGLGPDDPFFEFFRRFGPPDIVPEDLQRRSLGSGFIVSGDGYLLTNAHVIADAEDVTVKLTDKREFEAKVVGVDERTDVALVKIDARELPVVRIGDPAQVQVGQWVAAIGSPFGFDSTVTAGIVSAKGRALPGQTFVPFIQTDVAVNPGNSGGPLFNLNGEVIGINSQIYSRSGGYMGISFAIPIDLAMKVKEDLQKHGKVRRGRLGVIVQDVSQDLAESFGLAAATGALVSSVEPGTPAARAGLESGDVIVKFNDKAISNATDLSLAVSTVAPGAKVRIQLWRKGETKTLDAVVAELASVQARGEQSSDVDAERLGLTLRELTAAERAQLRTNGFLQVERAQGRSAAAGVRAGDVIISVNNERVTTISELHEAVNRADRTAALLMERDGQAIFIAIRMGRD